MNKSSAVRFRIPRDIWIGLLAAAGAAYYWRVADDIPISPLDGAVNAAVLPKALATAMIVFSALLIVRALIVEALFVRAARRLEAESAEADMPARPEDSEGKSFTTREHFKAAGVLLIGIIYLLLLPHIGYVPGIFLLVCAVAIYIGAKPGLYTAGVGLLVAVCFYLLFKRLLGIPMPAGIWPGLLG